jgi:O-methyltransferase involved in polyketide biosynthesis
MERPGWAPEGIDLTRPSNARLYDYFLGGAHNFAVDRELAEQIARMTPNIGETMRANRAFLRRAVRFLVAEGVRQFLDIGSGIPTVGKVAQQVAPDARVVYVDVDAVAVAHSTAILDDDPRTAVVCADLRDTTRVLAGAQTIGGLDLTQPVAVLMLGVVHFIPDAEDPGGIVAGYREAVSPGSFLALSHVTYEDQPPEVLAAFELSKRTPEPILPRSRAEITGYFGDFVLVEPGVVHIPLWRPDSPEDVGAHPERTNAFAGVARKV